MCMYTTTNSQTLHYYGRLTDHILLWTAISMSIGDRICFNSNFGTIRYIGTLSGKQGSWFGIEWDDPTRGRGDGSVGGIRYFTCR